MKALFVAPYWFVAKPYTPDQLHVSVQFLTQESPARG